MSLVLKNSTNVRVSIPPQLLMAPLKVAPFLIRPILTRLFLSPQKRTPSSGDALGQVVGTVRVGQELVRVRARGRGPTVLLVHGWQGSAAHLRAIGDRLLAGGYTVATCDMPAHGETGGRMTSLPEFAKTVSGAAALLGPLHGIVAHSLGATATVLAIRRGLCVRAALLVAPMPSFDFALDEFAKVLDLSPELREVAALGTEARVGILRAEADLHAFARPAVHVAVAHDVNDTRVPYIHSSDLVREWGLPSLYTTRGLGHRRILEDDGLGQWIERELGCVPPPSLPPLSFPLAPELSF